MNKEWRVIGLSPLLTFDKNIRYVVSRRKLSDEEVRQLFAQRFYYNLYDQLGISGGGPWITGCSTIAGGTKADAEAECERLNNGGKLFDGWFEEEAADGAEQ